MRKQRKLSMRRFNELAFTANLQNDFDIIKEICWNILEKHNRPASPPEGRRMGLWGIRGTAFHTCRRKTFLPHLDAQGFTIKYEDFNKDTEYGWTITHIIPQQVAEKVFKRFNISNINKLFNLQVASFKTINKFKDNIFIRHTIPNSLAYYKEDKLLISPYDMEKISVRDYIDRLSVFIDFGVISLSD